MPRKLVNTNREPQTWRLTVETASPQKIRIVVGNAKKPYTIYTDRYNTVKGKAVFYVRMPQTPDVAFLDVINQKNGLKKDGEDRTFKVTKFEKMALQTDYKIFDYNAKSKSFIEFLQDFCENAAIVSSNHSIYRSPDGVFRIDYLDNIHDLRQFVKDPKTGQPIKNKNYGRVMKTPARIGRKSGVIEVSKTLFLDYTVPMRMIVLLHEVAHVYLNKVDIDEVEADLNALKIYLGLGYPRIEAHQAFTEIFYNADTKLNRERYAVIRNYIQRFEEKQKQKGINH